MVASASGAEPLGAEVELQAPAEAAEEPVNAPESALWSPPPFELAWVELETSAEVDLPNSQPTLHFGNQSEEPIDVELTLLGDGGTTRSYATSLGSLGIGAGQVEEVQVALDALVAAKPMKYSGAAHVKARVLRAGTAEELAVVVSDPLYFHPVGTGLRVYDEVRHRDTYRSGDFASLLPDVAVTDADDFAVDRVVEYEKLPEDQLEAQEQAIAFDLASETEDNGTGELEFAAADGAIGEPAATGDLAAEPDPKAAYQHTICVRYEVDTTDSGYENSVGIKEDVWTDANDSVAYPASRGRVDVGSATLDLNDNGCATFLSAYSQTTLNVRVYAFASDSNGNLARVHDGDQNWKGEYPGDSSAKTYSIYVGSTYFQSPYPTYVNVGNHSARWTAVGALSKTLLRYADGISNTQFHLAEATDCTSAWNYHNDVVNDRSYLRIPGYSCSNGVHLRSKFLVAHEYGHGYLQQYANTAGVSAPLSHEAQEAAGCTDGGSRPYLNWSQEYSSLSFVEGYAHFISARVWNYKASDGQFRWGSSTDPNDNTDLERYKPDNDPGGWLVNVCCPNQSSTCITTQIDGHGVIFDWLRALWDQHTAPSSLGCSLSKAAMAAIYEITIEQSGLTDTNFWNATKGSFSVAGTDCYNSWLLYGCHNGIDREGQGWTGSC